MSTRRSLSSRLRSRRTAVWLLALLAAYSVVGTIIPQGSREVERVAQWARDYPTLDGVLSALGLHSAFSHPVFLLCLTVLALSTTLCAWERTRAAVRAWRRIGTVARSDAEALSARPTLRVPIGASQRDTALAAAASRLRAARLQVRTGPSVLEATAGRWGVFGSPLFHWGLALLFIVVGLGRLTRSEGLIGIPLDERRLDAVESYGVIEEGPLFLGHTALEIVASDLVRDFKTPDGVSRGPAPLVTLYRNGDAVMEHRVHPNSPLRYGPTMIHIDDTGYAVRISLESSAAVTLAEQTLLVDRLESEATRTASTRFALMDSAGQSAVEIEAWLKGSAEEPVLVLDVLSPLFRGFPQRYEAPLGETVTLPTGDRIRFASMGDYARLSVVHDWSVWPMYALLALTAIGISIAVLDPYRRVLVSVESAQDGSLSLHARILHGRDSALFEDAVAEALERASEDAGAQGVSNNTRPTEGA